MDSNESPDKGSADTLLLTIARKQRNLIAHAVRDAAAVAGLIPKGDKPKIPELMQLTQKLGEKAKATTERQAAVDRMAVPGKRFIPDWEAMEAIKRLDKTYYRHWSEDTLSGNDRQGYTSGNIPAGDLTLIVEYTRSQLIEHGGMKPAQNHEAAAYNPEMGKAALAYLASFGPEHAKVPEGFLFEELWKTMQSKQASPSVASTAPVAPDAPDFDAIKDKRMGELTPEQQDDAYELWLRNQAGWFKEQDALEFLFKRLDQARQGAPLTKTEVNQTAEAAPGPTAQAAQKDQDTLNQWPGDDLGDDNEDDMSHAPR